MKKRIRIILDPQITPGVFVTGGARVVSVKTDAELGLELRTHDIRVNGSTEAELVRDMIEKCPDMEEAA